MTAPTPTPPCLGEREAVARTERVTLAECPVGLFLADSGTLCLKTEYGNNEGRIDAYIVESGEFFWGVSPQTIVSQRRQMVRPVPATLRTENETLRARAEAAEKKLAERPLTASGLADALGCFSNAAIGAMHSGTATECAIAQGIQAVAWRLEEISKETKT